MITLDQVRCFVAVAEELHFGRAAARLSMTQPPVSRQIMKLEQVVGTELLHRNNRAVSLTVAGEAMLPRARRLLAIAEEAPELARQVATGGSGRLRVSFTATSIHGFVSHFLESLARELPGIDLHLLELVTSRQIDGLLAEELDLAFTRPSFHARAELESRCVAREPLVVAAPLSHPLVSGPRFSLDDLRGQPIIDYSQGDAQYFHELTVGALGGLQPQYVQRATQVHTVLALVSIGAGLALVPRSAQATGPRGVAYLEPTEPFSVEVELHAVWRRDAENAALQRSLEVLSAVQGHHQ